MNLFLFAIVGICTGFSILLAKHYGAGDLKQFRRQHFTALVLGLFCTVLLSLAGFVLLSRLMKLIQTPEDLMPYVLTYLRIILLSLPASFLYNFYASLLRSVGNTRAALYVLAAAVSANLMLDLLFVAGFSLGISGVAAATAITQVFSCLACLHCCHPHRGFCQFLRRQRFRRHLHPHRPEFRRSKKGPGSPVLLQQSETFIGNCSCLRRPHVRLRAIHSRLYAGLRIRMGVSKPVLERDADT